MGLLEYKTLEARTDSERIKLIKDWSTWFYDHTESFKPGDLGMQLAYLWAAIANAQKIDAEKSSALVHLLKDEGVDGSEAIWEYINVTNEGEPYCDHCGHEFGLDEKRVEYDELPFSVHSANKGESGVLCNGCDAHLKKEKADDGHR